MFVAAAVLNNGTVVRKKQLRNILLMSVTVAVLNNGTVARAMQD